MRGMNFGRTSSLIPVSEIEATLFHYSPELSGFFIWDGMSMVWSQLGEAVYPFAIVIEEDALATACVDYLRGAWRPRVCDLGGHSIRTAG